MNYDEIRTSSPRSSEAKCRRTTDLRERKCSRHSWRSCRAATAIALVIPKAKARNILDAEPDVLRRTHEGRPGRSPRPTKQAFAADGVMSSSSTRAPAGRWCSTIHVHVIPRFDGVPLKAVITALNHGTDNPSSLARPQAENRLRQGRRGRRCTRRLSARRMGQSAAYFQSSERRRPCSIRRRGASRSCAASPGASACRRSSCGRDRRGRTRTPVARPAA